MKKITFGIACALAALFAFVMMLTLYGRSMRQMETDTMLSQALDAAMTGIMQENRYEDREGGDGKSLIAGFLKALLIQKNSDSDLTVSVLDADEKLGLLSVELTETYRHPNGNEGSVSNRRTVIFDRKKEEEKERKTVSFYVSDELYKEYELLQGCVCTLPRAPKKEGKEFSCWRFVNGGEGEAEAVSTAYFAGSKTVLGKNGVPYPISEDTKLVAVFREGSD